METELGDDSDCDEAELGVLWLLADVGVDFELLDELLND